MSPSILFFSSTPTSSQYHYKVHLSTCHPPIILSFPLFISITICLWVGLIPIHINFFRCFVFSCPRLSNCLTILLIPYVFPNRQYGFTFLPDDCQKWNYASLMMVGMGAVEEAAAGNKSFFLDNHSRLIKIFFPAMFCPTKVRAVIPWMLNGLSITKIPFHTTERSTGRSLMSFPS